MKALRLHFSAPVDQNPLQSEQVSNPRPGPGQVRVKISVCGVCHTDLHTVEGEIHPPALPITPGHQVVGVIDALGPGVENWEKGQRVGVPWLHAACGTCEFCRRGEENLCPQARFTGFHVDGGYAETLLVDARYALPLPESLSDEQAAPLLCAGIVGYRALKKADIQPGERVGLFGFGASAHLMIQVLRYWGCKVSVFTRDSKHQEHARSLGAVWAGAAGQNPGYWLDRAVIFAPAGELVVRALEQIRPGGTVAVNAIHMSAIPTFPYEKIYGERTLRSVANATYRDGQEFLALAVAAGIESTVNLYPLEQANRALQDLKASRFNGDAVLQISPSPSPRTIRG
ncbi:MAG: zinc-dependent alcohol dehydrogenase family protein [Anaerolineales bacterium]